MRYIHVFITRFNLIQEQENYANIAFLNNLIKKIVQHGNIYLNFLHYKNQWSLILVVSCDK